MKMCSRDVYWCGHDSNTWNSRDLENVLFAGLAQLSQGGRENSRPLEGVGRLQELS